MARNRKLKEQGNNNTGGVVRDGARSRRRIKTKMSSVPLVIKCESNLCDVLLQSLGEMQCEGLASLPRRICDQWRKGSMKVDKSSRSRKMPMDRRARVKRSGMCDGREEVVQKTQRNRRSTKPKIRPRCKPLLPNRLLLNMAQSMRTPVTENGEITNGVSGATTGGTTSNGGTNGGTIAGPAQPQTAYAPIGAAIEAFCTPCPPTAPTYETNLMVVVSTQPGMMNHTFYSWNNKPDNIWAGYPTQPEPANIFNHIRNGLADISFMPFQEDPGDRQQQQQQLQEPVEEEQCHILPKTVESTVDIYEHIRNMLSESPICDQTDQMM